MHQLKFFFRRCRIELKSSVSVDKGTMKMISKLKLTIRTKLYVSVRLSFSTFERLILNVPEDKLDPTILCNKNFVSFVLMGVTHRSCNYTESKKRKGLTSRGKKIGNQLNISPAALSGCIDNPISPYNTASK